MTLPHLLGWILLEVPGATLFIWAWTKNFKYDFNQQTARTWTSLFFIGQLIFTGLYLISV